MTVTELMARPSTHFEPADPIPLRSVFIDADEFNYLSIHHRKAIEPGDGVAVLVIGGVRYLTKTGEAPC